MRPDGTIGYATEGDVKISLKSFKGWYCASGYTLLSINARGEVKGNICKSGASLGNIYTGDISLPKHPIICDKAQCHCSADLKIPKAQSLESLKKIYKHIDDPILGISSFDSNATAIRRTYHLGKTFCIDWNIGNRCNYNCSYCSPRLHNNHSPHLSYELWCSSIDKLYSLLGTRNILLTIVGGEPTINPQYLKMCSYAHRCNVKIVTTTNGTASLEKLKAILAYGGITLSVHSEFCDIDKLISKINALSKYTSRKHKINISFMMMPGEGAAYNRFKSRLIYCEGIICHAVPIYDAKFKLLQYSQEEVSLINGSV